MPRDHEPTLAEPTFVMRAPKPRRPAAATRGFAERLALFVSGVERTNAEELLAGLASPTRQRATAFARDALGWDSATRQGRMAVAFGSQPDATGQLKQLMAAASPAMRVAIHRHLAPWQQSLFPSLHGQQAAPVAPAMDELAVCLIREATGQSP